MSKCVRHHEFALPRFWAGWRYRLRSARSWVEKIPDDRRNPLELVIGQFGVNGKAEAFTRRLFGDGKIAWFMAEEGIALLQVQRERIVQRATDLIGFQMLLEFIAAGVAHGVNVINAFGVVRLARELQGGVGEQFMIPVGHAPALARPVVQMLQFDIEHRALNAFHAIIKADFVVVITL